MLRKDAARCIVLILMLAGSTAWAQTSPPAAALPLPVGPEPATTTASYGDWILRCQEVSAAGAAKRICEVVQTMQMQGQHEPVAQVAFGKGQGGDLHFVVALPVNISFPSQVLVALADKDPKPVPLDWKRCIPGACFADGAVGRDVLDRWRTATGTATVQFRDAAGRAFALPMSLRGAAQALDALARTP